MRFMHAIIQGGRRRPRALPATCLWEGDGAGSDGWVEKRRAQEHIFCWCSTCVPQEAIQGCGSYIELYKSEGGRV